MSSEPQTGQFLAKYLAKKYNYPPDVAADLVNMVQQREHRDTLNEFMAVVKENREALAYLPPQVQQQVLGGMASAVQLGGGSNNEYMSDLRKMMTEMTIIREGMRGGSSDGASADMTKKIEELTKKIDDAKAADTAKTIENYQKEVKEELKKLSEEFKAKVSALQPGTPVDDRSFIVRTVEELKAWKDSEANLREIFGGNQQQGGSSFDITQNVERLKALGFEIKPPKSLDQIEKDFDERMKFIVKDTEEKTTLKLKSDDKKMALLISLGQAALDGFLPALLEGKGGAETLQAAKEALKSVQPET